MPQSNLPGCLSCPHRTGTLQRCCTPDELELLVAHKSVQRYQRGQTIYQQGNKVLGLHCMHEGKIKITRASGDNKEHILELVRPGELMGWRPLLADSLYTTSAVALEDSLVCFLPKNNFLSLLQSNIQFSNSLLRLMATTLGIAEAKVLELAHKPVRERLASALVLLQQTYGTPEASEPFSISLAREDVAALIGTAKETVSRLLSKFKDEDLIALQGSRITLLRFRQLTDIATRHS